MSVSIFTVKYQVAKFAKNEVFRLGLRPEEKLPCQSVPRVNKQ